MWWGRAGEWCTLLRPFAAPSGSNTLEKTTDSRRFEKVALIPFILRESTAVTGLACRWRERWPRLRSMFVCPCISRQHRSDRAQLAKFGE